MTAEVCKWKSVPFSTPFNDRIGPHPGFDDELIIECVSQYTAGTIRHALGMIPELCPYCGKKTSFTRSDTISS
jgi:hypothetical protein